VSDEVYTYPQPIIRTYQLEKQASNEAPQLNQVNSGDSSEDFFKQQ
jgi:hypothetical protein